MQIVLKNENKRSNIKKADPMDDIICTESISYYIERKYVKRLRIRRNRV